LTLTVAIFQIVFTTGALFAETGSVPQPHLVTMATLSNMRNGSYQAVVTIRNMGNATANNVWLISAWLGRTGDTPASERLSDIAGGSEATATINFGANAGAPGLQVLEKFFGSYVGGTYGGTSRVMLPSSPAAVPTVTATIDPAQLGKPTPYHFLGFSMDSTVTDTYVGNGTSADPILVNLINNFTPYNGVPVLRPAASPATPTSSNISAKFLAALILLKRATNAPLIVTIGLSTYNPTYAANVAASVTGAIGNGKEIEFELGNEPDQLVHQGDRSSSYTFSDYLQEYEGYEAAVSPYIPGRFAAGMASGSTSWDSANDAAFLAAQSGTLGTITSHEYPLSACDGTSSINIAHLLSDNISNAFLRRFQPIVAAAAPYGIPVRAGEMNSVSCSGLSGVSNTFASSLWLLDSLFELQESGASGMNLYTGSTTSGTPDLPYNGFYVNGTQVQVRPVYYGMLMFAEAIQHSAGQIPVTTTRTGTQNVKIWGTEDRDHVARIIIIEKDLDDSSQTVAINLGSHVSAIGQLVRLQTTSSAGLSATDQVYLHGQTFDETTDGHLVGKPVTSPVLPVDGKYTVDVPDGSAAMLTVRLCPDKHDGADNYHLQREEIGR
jgi:hypothetical protein